MYLYSIGTLAYVHPAKYNIHAQKANIMTDLALGSASPLVDHDNQCFLPISWSIRTPPCQVHDLCSYCTAIYPVIL